jgi:uncharacterized phage-associated protein
LGLLDRQAFHDKIEAWEQGPVIDEVYQDYKSYNAHETILCNDDEADDTAFQKISIDGEIKWIVDEVIRNFAPVDGDELSQMTHSDAPWLLAREQRGRNGTITDYSLREHFSDPPRALIIRYENYPRPKSRYSARDLMKRPVAERMAMIRDAMREAEIYAKEHNIDLWDDFDEPYLTDE